MCTNEGARGSMTPARPRWLRLYALAGLMLGALLLTQALTASGTERTVLQCGLVLGGFAAMAQWTRRNRAALDHLDWCDCASSRVTMRVIPSAVAPRPQLIQRRTRVASDRKIVMPSTSCNAVSKGPAVIAGSNPSRLESIGIIVPAKPDRFTEANIERATTSAKAAECQNHPTKPTTSAHTPPRMLEVCTCRRSGSHQRLSCTCPVASPRTTIVTD